MLTTKEDMMRSHFKGSVSYAEPVERLGTHLTGSQSVYSTQTSSLNASALELGITSFRQSVPFLKTTIEVISVVTGGSITFSKG